MGVRLFVLIEYGKRLSTYSDAGAPDAMAYLGRVKSAGGSKLGLAWAECAKGSDYPRNDRERYVQCKAAIAAGRVLDLPAPLALERLEEWTRKTAIYMDDSALENAIQSSVPRKPKPQLPVEVWHEVEFDADKAMEAIRALSKGM